MLMPQIDRDTCGVCQITSFSERDAYIARMSRAVPHSLENLYRKLNSIGKKKPMSLDEWMSLIAPLIALSIPRLTGIPDRIGVPSTLFAVFAIYTLVRHRSGWLRRIILSGTGCLALYGILTLAHHR